MSAKALILPSEMTQKGWAPVEGNVHEWQDSSGECTLREERHDQSFPVLKDAKKARAFSIRLQKALVGSGKQIRSAVSQPVNLGDQLWSVLTSYVYNDGHDVFAMTQLFTHENGKLRTYTGSSTFGKRAPCITDMHKFLRYGINKNIINPSLDAPKAPLPKPKPAPASNTNSTTNSGSMSATEVPALPQPQQSPSVSTVATPAPDTPDNGSNTNSATNAQQTEPEKTKPEKAQPEKTP